MLAMYIIYIIIYIYIIYIYIYICVTGSAKTSLMDQDFKRTGFRRAGHIYIYILYIYYIYIYIYILHKRTLYFV